MIPYAGYATAIEDRTGADLELLAHPGSQHANQVISMSACHRSAAAGDFIGNPAAAGHRDYPCPPVTSNLVCSSMIGNEIVCPAWV
jgi:hypothetical protein